MDKSTIFLQLLEKSSLTIVLFIIITKIKGFKYIFQKENYKLNLERGLAIKNQGKLLYTYNDLDFLSEGRKLVLNTLLPKPINDIND